MSKKLVGGIIAIIAVAALIAAFVLTRPDDAGYGSSSTSDSMSHDTTASDTTDTESDSEPVAANTVDISNFAYDAETITVTKGTTVTWTNQDTVDHTVTGTDGGPDSALLSKGQSYSYTFDEVGTFEYFCKPHPYMTGKVVVTE